MLKVLVPRVPTVLKVLALRVLTVLKVLVLRVPTVLKVQRTLGTTSTPGTSTLTPAPLSTFSTFRAASLRSQRPERLLPEDVVAGRDADDSDEGHRDDRADRGEPGRRTPRFRDNPRFHPVNRCHPD